MLPSLTLALQQPHEEGEQDTPQLSKSSKCNIAGKTVLAGVTMGLGVKIMEKVQLCHHGQCDGQVRNPVGGQHLVRRSDCGGKVWGQDVNYWKRTKRGQWSTSS